MKIDRPGNYRLNRPAFWLEGHTVFRTVSKFMRFLRLPIFIRGHGTRMHTRKTPVRNGQFASFMSVQGCNRRHPDRHDRRLQFQKLARVATLVAAGIGFAWVALESARAISFF